MDDVSYSIICCFFNEKKLLENKFNDLIKGFQTLPFKKEIIFCDNNSTDGSTELLKKFEKLNIQNSKFIFNKENLGKGGSIKEAIKNSNNEYIVIFDIDEYLLEDVEQGHKIIEKNRSIDFLCGNRISRDYKFIYKKNLYGVIALTKLINFLFKTNLTDSACATKIFKRSIYNQIDVKTNNFDFEFEVLCKFAKLNSIFQEYVVSYFPRSFAEGKKLRAFRDGTMILKIIIINFLFN